ncbi:MAG: hypothetical protein KF754_15800 [Planctomycetes bacterium]|nr:hypothetical protein [Planctomycetota bacterium]
MLQYWPWCGIWGGSGKAQDGRPVHIRMSVERRLHGHALRMNFEASSPDGGVLYHGVVSLVGVGPTGQVRAATFSTIHGAMVLDQTPDDAGVLALAGNTLAGNSILVTLHDQGPGKLGFAAQWRPPGAKADDPRMGRMAADLARLVPMRIPAGPPRPVQ